MTNITNNLIDEKKLLDFNISPNLNCIRFLDIKKEYILLVVICNFSMMYSCFAG